MEPLSYKELRVPGGESFFLLQSQIQLVPLVVILGIKWPGHEADHSPVSSAEVRKARFHTSNCGV
jgi:hypothetical protein